MVGDEVYMVGTVNCGGLPVTTPGAYETACTNANQNFYAYLAIFNTAKSGAASLVYSTYFGPSATQVFGVAVDSSGAAFLTGIVSVNLPFPVTAGALQSTCQSETCAFVSKINPSIPGQAALVSSTLFGGENVQAIPWGIALDANENVYIAGTVVYNAEQFRTTSGAYQPIPKSTASINGYTGFLAKLSPTLTGPEYSTLLGGSSVQEIFALSVAPDGQAAVTGQTNSPDFPVTPDAFQRTFKPADADAFLSVFSADGSQLTYSTYLGGVTRANAGAAVAFGTTGDVYIAGDTSSPFFPTTPGAFQTQYGSSSLDAFITEFLIGTREQLSVTRVYPETAGNTGIITVTVFGGGFHSGATPSLECSSAVINGMHTSVDQSGEALTTVFNLTGTASGTCSVRVMNPDGNLAALDSPFVIERGGGPQLTVNVLAKSHVGVGHGPTTFSVLIANTGNEDASGVVVSLYGIPANATLVPLFNVSANPTRPGTPSFDFSQAPFAPVNGQEQIPNLLLAAVPAGSSILLPFSLTLNSFPPPPAPLFPLPPPPPLGFKPLPPQTGPVINITALLSLIKNFCSDSDCLDVVLGSLPPPFGDVFNLQSCVKDGICLYLQTVLAQVPRQFLNGQGTYNFTQIITELLLDCLGTVLDIPKGLELASTVIEGILNCQGTLSDGESQVSVGVSGDPNEKQGVNGATPAHWLSGQQPFSYSIYFANKPTATAAAQLVDITDRLDPSIDLTSLAVNAAVVGGRNVFLVSDFNPAVNRYQADKTLDLRPSQNLIINMHMNLDPMTRVLSWRFTSIDPTTGKPPADSNLGVLPRGTEGVVIYSARHITPISTGAKIANAATVVFDGRAPLLTPTWSNKIDETAPISAVSTLPPAETTSCFVVPWTGSDLGSGLARFTLFASDNGGRFTAPISNTTRASTVFKGLPGHTYSFYTQATDLVGNMEAAKNAAEATTTVMAGASCNGRPTLSGSIASKSKPGTTETVTLQITNTGVGNATSASLNQVIFQTRVGSGTVKLISPAMPIQLGSLAAGTYTTVTLTLQVPSTVKEFSLAEQGTLQDVKGDRYAFSIGQTIFP